jgi:signal transduction histidine kinase
MKAKDARPERKHTDESLAVERAKSDDALDGARAALEEKADGVVEHAREEADDVLTAARVRADDLLNHPESPEQATEAIALERAREDRALRDERAEADEALRLERKANARLMDRLLPLEREKTDQFLLTERARSDDALANRDDFLGMVSHDLRDLLNGIVINAEYIASHTSKSEEGRAAGSAAQRIQRSAGRMARLIGDLNDIASIDAGKLAITPALVDVTDAVREALETWAPPALAKGIVLETGPLSPMMASVDNGRILQVLGNLITNALKFSARGTNVVVGVEEIDGDVRFSVRDEGQGIPEDKLEAIFERFWQLGGTGSRGLGLGLYISKCLVLAHGGKVWAESELGRGSTFFFTIPGAARPQAR